MIDGITRDILEQRDNIERQENKIFNSNRETLIKKQQQEIERYKNIINTVRNCILTDISMLKTIRPEMSKEEIIMRLEATIKLLDKLEKLKGE